MMREASMAVMVVMSLFTGGFLLATPVSAQEVVNVNIQGGNDIDIRANNVKRDNAVEIPFEARTSAERQFGIDLERFEVWTYQDMGGFNLNMDIRSTPPHGEEEINGVETLSYLDIQPRQISDEDIEDLRFRFSVYKGALEDLNAGSDDVVLHRYTNNTWNRIDLSVVEETTDRYMYEATLPGLSVFSIGARQPVFSINDVSVNSTSIPEGGSVELSTVVQNSGSADGTLTLNLKIDDEIVDSQSISLEPGSTNTVTFTRTFDTIGEYELTVNNASGVEVRVSSDAGGDGADGGGGNASDNGSELPGFGALVGLAALISVIAWRRFER